MDWECGSRSVQTLRKMLDRVEQLEVKVFFADIWGAYVELVPQGLLVWTKAEVYGVECDNFRQRYWCGCFCCKICMVSRSLRMIDLTIFLFGRFHINGS